MRFRSGADHQEGRAAITEPRILCITVSAEQDLVDIWCFIAQNNPDAVSTLIRQIEARFSSIGYVGPDQYISLIIIIRSRKKSSISANFYIIYCIYICT